MIDRKWIMVEPTMTQGIGCNPPNPKVLWTPNTFINGSKLLQAKRYHILSPDLLNDKADAYYLISCIDHHLDLEIEFVKRVRKEGSKVVLAISQDSRFQTGHGLLQHDTNTVYTDLCKEVDCIWGGVPPDLHIYGSNQNKVIDAGDFIERSNRSTKPYNERTIDLLGTGGVGEVNISFYIVLFSMIKEKYPDKRVVYAFRNLPDYTPVCIKMQNKFSNIEFIQYNFPDLLNDSKAYINLELRPRGGRAVLEAWYHRVPSISFDQTYFSKLFPEFSFDMISFDKIFRLYEKMMNSDYNKLIKKSEKIMEYDYFEKVYDRIINKLDEVK